MNENELTNKKIAKLKDHYDKLHTDVRNFESLIETLDRVKGSWIVNWVVSGIDVDKVSWLRSWLDQYVYELKKERDDTHDSIIHQKKKLQKRREHIDSEHIGDSARVNKSKPNKWRSDVKEGEHISGIS